MTDWRRVAVVESADGISSGYRITPHLVLTAGHGISDPSSGGKVRVAFMLSPRQRWKATVVWHSRYGCRAGSTWQRVGECHHQPPAVAAAESLDLALLCVDAGPDGAQAQAPVRWGRFATGERQRAEAVGFPNRQRYQGYLDPYGVQGTISPATGRWTQLPSLDLPGWSMTGGTDDWRGLSGAAVFVSEFYVGCVQTFDRTRFKVMPADRMLFHPCLRAWITRDAGTPPVEPADLCHVFTAPPPRPRTPAQLLDPEVRATPFRGSRELVQELAQWCRNPEDAEARLLTGSIGVGKTRTAVELIRELALAPEPWAAGFLRQETLGARQWDIFQNLQANLLLVVDRAESRDNDEIETLLNAAAHHRDRVRILLLARSEDPWDGKCLPTAVPPFAEGVNAQDLYAAAREALAYRLDALKTRRTPGSLSNRPAIIRDADTPAEVQLIALTDLLWERGLAHLAEDARMVLLDMERQYVRSAVRRRLPRVDETLLDLVLTSVALSGGRDESDSARDVLEALRFRYRYITAGDGLRTDYRVVREVDTILESLSSLYPPREAEHHSRLPDTVVAAQIVRAWGDERAREFVCELLADDMRLNTGYALEEAHCLFPDEVDGLPSPWDEPGEAGATLREILDAMDVSPELPETPPAPYLASRKPDAPIAYDDPDHVEPLPPPYDFVDAPQIKDRGDHRGIGRQGPWL
ncbi:hypothetical protein [Streptomyces sp. NPDC003720]|uniref:hypothetical protein n=1 Tax=Streptomyces sp. NPDC003720 TaxID=3364684 RepID=UPI0036974A84